MLWRPLNCFDFWLHCRLSVIWMHLCHLVSAVQQHCTRHDHLPIWFVHCIFVLLFSLVVRHKIVFCVTIACIQFIYWEWIEVVFDVFVHCVGANVYQKPCDIAVAPTFFFCYYRCVFVVVWVIFFRLIGKSKLEIAYSILCLPTQIQNIYGL